MYTQIVHRGEPLDLSIEGFTKTFNLDQLDWNVLIDRISVYSAVRTFMSIRTTVRCSNFTPSSDF